MTIEVNFPARLRELRRATGLTQLQLAERTGISLGTLRNWEIGHRVPELDWMVLLAAGLGVKPCALLLPPDKDEPPPGPGRPRKPAAEQPPEKPKRSRGRPKKGKGGADA